MRADPVDYELVAPGSLQDVLSLLAAEPGAWLPIAGGTDVMVLYAAGKLAARRMVSISNIRELRGIEVTPNHVSIGAGCAYTDLRRHPVIQKEFPLLASAAALTGGIANQNRGTLGGNIANASPAADSLPALLVYDAELALVSFRGERRIPYNAFHSGYKKMDIAADELIRTICLPRKFGGYISYSRKIGARNAQAIAKACIAALGKLRDGIIEDVHIALGSVAPIPLRLRKTEQFLAGRKRDSELMNGCREVLASEIHPIDDIRSTSCYRMAVSQNLLAEFLEKLRSSEADE